MRCGRAAARFFSPDAFFGIKVQNQRGDGSEFDSLREYVAGLDHRAIDWKHSARHRKLLCKEFRAERNHQIVLALDTGQLMSEPIAGIPKLDHAINAGLLLGLPVAQTATASACSASTRRSATIPPPRRHAALRAPAALVRRARLSARGDQLHARPHQPVGRLNRRSLVVLITDFVDTVTAELMVENLARLARRHLVLFVTLQDPHLFARSRRRRTRSTPSRRSVVADGFVRERAVVFERLRRLGVHCLDVPAERIGMALINRYLLIKQRELI